MGANWFFVDRITPAVSLNSNNPNSTGSPCNEQNSFKDVEYWESQFPFGISELRNSDYPISYLCVEKVKRIVQSNQRIWTLFCQCVSFTNRCRFWSQKGQPLKYNNNYSNNDSNQPFRMDLCGKVEICGLQNRRRFIYCCGCGACIATLKIGTTTTKIGRQGDVFRCASSNRSCMKSIYVCVCVLVPSIPKRLSRICLISAL